MWIISGSLPLQISITGETTVSWEGRTDLTAVGQISLSTRLWIACVLIGACLIGLAAAIVVPSVQAYRQAQTNVKLIERFRLVLNTANAISAERGPSNIILSLMPRENPTLAEELQAVRLRTDQALDRLVAMETERAVRAANPGTFGLMPDITRTREQLRRGRELVDLVSNTPLQERDFTAINDAIVAMIAAVDVFQSAIALEIRTSSIQGSGLATYLAVGHMVSDLREYGGRIGSHIMANVITRQPMSVQTMAEKDRSHGRLLEIERLLQAQRALLSEVSGSPADPLSEINVMFFGRGLSLIDEVVGEGRTSGNYPVTALGLTRRLVATFQPLERLRASFLTDVVSHVEAAREAALARLVWVSSATVLALLVLAGLVHTVYASILWPLNAARRSIIELTEQGSSAQVPTRSDVDEMGRVFDALAGLRDRFREQELKTAELQNEATHDALTGLWNRRPLERFMRATQRASDACTGLILIDIDHFKQINDTHGHKGGDEVLMQFANLLRSETPPSTVVARIGGEEFAILMPGASLTEATHLAHRLQGIVERHPIAIPESVVTLRVSASFGVAAGSLHGAGADDLFRQADRALYNAKAHGRNCVRVMEPRRIAV